MSRMWIAAVAALGLMGLGHPAFAAPQGAAQRHATPHGASQARPLASDLSSQRRVRRSPVRIIVYPQGYRRLIGPRYFGIDLYPRPYPYDWPGPLAKRDCVAWLAAQSRPSGPVVVPRQRCWWTPG